MRNHPQLVLFLWIALILILIWLVAIRPARLPNSAGISPERQIERKEAVFEGTLRIIQGNTLYPSSYLPHFAGQVLGIKVNQNPITSYCDPRYLETWWPAHLVSDASKICYCEGKGFTDLINDTPGVEYSIGLFQINSLAHENYDREKLKEATYNIRAAIEIFSDPETGGWQNWYWCSKWTGVLP